ncbi:MAG: hypothetical protein IT342_21220 [Candidatus Melainabacteria bacterium]|nr:hypothetical protein [Candidatus Melainabacteria bacterium]
MPNNSWDAAFDVVRHNPEQSALMAPDRVRERASSAGVHEAYDAMRQQSRANQFDPNGARMDGALNGAGATTLNFADGSRIEALLAGDGKLPANAERLPAFESERDQRRYQTRLNAQDPNEIFRIKKLSHLVAKSEFPDDTSLA